MVSTAIAFQEDEECKLLGLVVVHEVVTVLVARWDCTQTKDSTDTKDTTEMKKKKNSEASLLANTLGSVVSLRSSNGTDVSYLQVRLYLSDSIILAVEL